MEFPAYILPLIFAVAFLYSSVGHGGASGYLAIMAMMGISTEFMRSNALLLNFFVAGIALIQFARNGFFRFSLLWPYAVVSVPASFLGALVKTDPFWYNKILAVFLFIAAIRIFGFSVNRSTGKKIVPFYVSLLVGGIIGFFSGMIGIGGGILLSPFLFLTGQSGTKEISAASAGFILVNSFSGIGGLMLGGNATFLSDTPYWIIAAAAGGLLGSYTGSVTFKPVMVKNMLAVILIFACGKLMLT